MKRHYLATLFLSLGFINPAFSNPMQPPTIKQGKPALKMELQGLFFRGGEYSAFINGRELKAGSRIRGYTLKRITTEGVEMVKGQKRLKLTLIDSSLKQRRN